MPAPTTHTTTLTLMDMARGRPRNLADSSLSLQAQTTTQKCIGNRPKGHSMGILASPPLRVDRRRASFHISESVRGGSRDDIRPPSHPPMTTTWRPRLDVALGLATGRPWLLTN